jgi:hypothetical protein
MRKARPVPTVLALVLLAAAADASALSPPAVPEALRPPAGQSLHLEALATGVQIYECSPKGEGFEWAFKGPEAALADRSGKALGKHYGGPTWESTDGSAVVGEVKAKDPGPDPSAIPWLLLGAKSNKGPGTFAETKSVQRIATKGGAAPSAPCTAAKVKEVARVPYTATYYFYK